MTKTRARPARRPLVHRPLARRWTAGDVLSWVLGATLGLILGVTLLIVTARVMRAPAAQTAPPASASAEGIQATTPAPAPAGEAAESGEAKAMDASGSADTADTPSPAEARPSEDSTAAAPATEEAAAGDAAAGQAKYAASCAGCHGAQAQGGVGPALANAAAWSDAEFLTALREGKTPAKTLGPIMPRFTSAQLSDEDVVNVHAYVKSLN